MNLVKSARYLMLASSSLMSLILIVTGVKGSFVDKDTSSELNAMFFLVGNILALLAVKMWLHILAYKGPECDQIVRCITMLLGEEFSKIVIESDSKREDIDIAMETNFLGTKYRVNILSNEQYLFVEDDVVYNHEFRITYTFELADYMRSITYDKTQMNVRDMTNEFLMPDQALTQPEQHELERLGKGAYRYDQRTISRYEREFKFSNQEKSKELNDFLIRAMRSKGVRMDG